MAPYIFEARNVSKSFGVIHALKGVSLGISEGQVHAVIGENGAGKSTLMNIFCGKLQPSSGTLVRNGQDVTFHSPIDAQAAEVAIAPQEISLVSDLTVAENIYLGSQATKGLVIDWKRTRARAAEHLSDVDNSIDPSSLVRNLSKAQQQLVQIARAVATEAKIIIFDEPTAALTYHETERLYAFIKSFRRRGGAVFYISHRLDEILELSDVISVMRDGQHVATLDPRTTTKDDMVRHMAGRLTGKGNPEPHVRIERNEVVLKVDKLSRKGEFENISFELHKGEILGVSGLIGSGRTELAKCIFGLTRADAGSIDLYGEPARITAPADAINKGLVYLPEERKQEGIFPLLSIGENMVMPNLSRFTGVLTMRVGDMMREVDSYVRSLQIKIGSPRDPITSLSGGNQQKVIIARWLMKQARILIMDEPTRGIDVNAKAEIQKELRQFTDRSGLSIIFISSELEEVLDVSDRILVMHEGRIKGVQNAQEATQKSLLQLAMS